MGAGGTAGSTGEARRPLADGEHPRSVDRRVHRADDRLPVAGIAQGPAAQEHGARISRTVGMGRHSGPHPPCAVRRGPRDGRKRGQPNGGDHRQPERQGRGKRGARIDPAGYDAGKKVKGKKRHIVVDTLGMILAAHIQPADVQDRDGALPVLKEVRRLFPFIERVFADGGYQGAATTAAVRELGAWHLEIVKRSDTAKGFEVLPKRWIVRAHLQMAGAMPSPRQRLREPLAHSTGLPTTRDDPPHAAQNRKAQKIIGNFADGL